MGAWIDSDYPEVMAQLDGQLRNTAITYGHELLEVGFSEERAAHLGAAIASELGPIEESDGSTHRVVRFERGHWVVRREDTDEITHVFNGRDDAARRARQLSRRDGGTYEVLAPDGALLHEGDFTGEVESGGDQVAVRHHVMPFADGWAVKSFGNGALFETFDTKRAALKEAKRQAKEHDSMLVVHYASGDVQKTHDYAH